ncbi:ras-related protein Rab-23 isoform X1 [Cloeon dipterum]|uniref:Ras-related protein Rab-23 n=2 Tax=Cloeon dipterum TaxID=197152 RepID=A0A8S1E6M0_9INSE|nr:Hypothetical predicted protein [Cloeon dipterum]
MYEEELEVAIKVVIVGNGAVGKSSMIQRYCKGIFTRDYKKTIGVDFLERQISLGGEEVRLMVWDTAGQEEFDAITRAYYRGAQACVLAFSTTDRDSFEAVRSWKKKVEDECGEIPTVLVQNKIDLADHSVVEPEEAEMLARSLGCRLFRVSVKEDVNVGPVFRHLAACCLEEMHAEEEAMGMGGYQPPAISAFSLPVSPLHKGSKHHHHHHGAIAIKSRGRRIFRTHHAGKNMLRGACSII